MTPPVDLNLSTRPFRNNTLLWTAHGLACALLLAFSAWNVEAFLGEGGALAELRGELAQVSQRMSALDMRDQRAQTGIAHHDLKELSTQATTANEVILMKALSWTRLFNLLEKVVPYEVKTVAIRPSFSSIARSGPDATLTAEAVPVTMQGIAQSIEAFLEFERSLIVDPHFDQVEPEKTDVVQGGEVAFQLGFLYFPEGKTSGKGAPNLPHVLDAAAEEAASPEELRAVGGAGGDGGSGEGAAPAASGPARAPGSAAPVPPGRKPAQTPPGRPATRVDKGGKR